MLYFLVTCISFIFFLKSLHLKPLPSWVSDVRFLPLLFWKDLSFSFLHITKAISKSVFGGLTSVLAMKRENPSSKHKSMGINEDMSVLDLPDLVLECTLEKLSPAGLYNMASVCRSLREKCTSDYFWEKHMNQKWGKVLGPASYQEWQRFIASRRDSIHSKTSKSQGIVRFIWNVCSLSRFMSKHDEDSKVTVSPRDDSVMSWYLALENGKFWFPAQVYNRENGHVGFMLSCYDAELSYDSLTDTFQARYTPHGRRMVAMENGVQWERIRAAPVNTSPHDLHITDCLNDLHPGDHIEIQWRKNKEFPYGWWYGVVGHLESCDGNEKYCLCHSSDTVVLEFRQYAVGSRWRRTNISKKDHREEGNESDGFYGGIRKLYKNDEIRTWKKLWPTEILE